MNGPGEWEQRQQTALRDIVDAYTEMLNARMEFGASGGDAWLRRAGYSEDKIKAYIKAIEVFGMVEMTLTSNADYIPIFYAARNGELPIALMPPESAPAPPVVV